MDTKSSTRLIALLGAYLCIAGCVPAREHYQRVEVPGATYLQGLCGYFGAPDWTYYPFNGIFISVALSPDIQVGLHYPVGTTARFDSTTIEIKELSGTEAVDVVGDLRPAIHAAMGNAAPERFDASFDPQDPNGLHGYRRTSEGRGFVWESFRARDQGTPERSLNVPRKLVHGVLIIPAITVNGRTYGPQVLPILNRVYMGILPVNC
jgi:hypothetical protein